MKPIELWLRCDIKQGSISTQFATGTLFSQDNMANLIGVKMYEDGAEMSLSGGCAGKVMRADGATVTVSGTVSGNKAYIVLPQACYAVPGEITVSVLYTEGSGAMTVGQVRGSVTRSVTGTIVDPGSVVPDVSQIVALYGQMSTATTNATAAAATANTAANNANAKAAAANSAAAAADAAAAKAGNLAITTQYYLSTSDQTPTGGSWSSAPPAYAAGKYYWARDIVTYGDSTTSTGEAYLCQALNDLYSAEASRTAEFDDLKDDMQQAIADLEAAGLYDALDQTFAAMLDGSNTTSIFWKWWPLSSANGDSKYERLSRFARMAAAAWQDKVYTLRSYNYTVSGAPAMTPLADLADKQPAQLCTENTTPVADWADEDPMTWYIRANALSLADGTMNITYLEGEDGFDITGETAPVYTFALSLWFNDYTDGQYDYITFSTAEKSGLYPMPGDVGPDNKKRALTWHPSFPGGLNSQNALTSGAGLKPYISVSAGAGLTDARKMTAYEGLWNDCDTHWLLRMWQLRHFNLENSGILEGCLNYDVSDKAALAEENATRVLVASGRGSRYVVGSCVCVGDMGGSASASARGTGYNNIANLVKIGSIESVTVEGTAYDAISLLVDAPFTIPSTAAMICTMPYYSGDTEAVPGHKDGCRVSLTSGKTPIRVAGVEVLDGAYTLGLDPLYSVAWDSENSTATYTVYECRDSEKLASSVTANYQTAGIVSAAMTPGWKYVKAFVRNRLGILFPDVIGGSASTYYKSAFSVAPSAGVRCPWRFCYLSNGGNGGLAGGYGISAPAYAYWYGRPRLSGAGKKRGEWAMA